MNEEVEYKEAPIKCEAVDGADIYDIEIGVPTITPFGFKFKDANHISAGPDGFVRKSFDTVEIILALQQSDMMAFKKNAEGYPTFDKDGNREVECVFSRKDLSKKEHDELFNKQIELGYQVFELDKTLVPKDKILMIWKAFGAHQEKHKEEINKAFGIVEQHADAKKNV